VLLKHWRLQELKGLDEAAEHARDQVLAFMEGFASAT
jgi:hypothetical protein